MKLSDTLDTQSAKPRRVWKICSAWRVILLLPLSPRCDCVYRNKGRDSQITRLIWQIPGRQRKVGSMGGWDWVGCGVVEDTGRPGEPNQCKPASQRPSFSLSPVTRKEKHARKEWDVLPAVTTNKTSFRKMCLPFFWVPLIFVHTLLFCVCMT